jgi:hypothetical protein
VCDLPEDEWFLSFDNGKIRAIAGTLARGSPAFGPQALDKEVASGRRSLETAAEAIGLANPGPQPAPNDGAHRSSSRRTSVALYVEHLWASIEEDGSCLQSSENIAVALA